jgi:anti-repressor protein
MYGFSENIDYARLSQKCDTPGGKQNIVDYQLTIDMAKELCMIQRTEKGKEARQYFIKVENAWNDPTTIMARALKIADAKINRLETQVKGDKPKVLFADAVATAKSSILVGELAKLIRQNGYEIGQKRLFKWLRGNGYLNTKGEEYNTPSQYSMERGLMEIKKSVVNNPDGTVFTTKTPKVTGKGQQYFINKFLSKEV